MFVDCWRRCEDNQNRRFGRDIQMRDNEANVLDQRLSSQTKHNILFLDNGMKNKAANLFFFTLSIGWR